MPKGTERETKKGRSGVAKSIKIPKTKNEADALILEIGQLQGRSRKIQHLFEQRFADFKKETRERIEEIEKEIKDHLFGLFAFFQENQKELTENGKISIVRLPSGEMQIFLTSPAIGVRKEEQVIESLLVAGLGRFVRSKPEINREAILQEPEAISGFAGIKIYRKERFLVKPNLTNESVTEDTKKLKKLLK